MVNIVSLSLTIRATIARAADLGKGGVKAPYYSQIIKVRH
jgi:hypothetical protein